MTSVRAQLCVPARERVWWVMNEKGLLHYGRETRKMEPALWIGVAIAVIASCCGSGRCLHATEARVGVTCGDRSADEGLIA